MTQTILIDSAPPKAAVRPRHKLEEVLRAARAKMRLLDIEGYEKAVAFLRHAIDEAPFYAPAHALLAEAYSLWGFRLELNGGRAESYYSLAVNHAETAVRLAPERADSHRAVSVALRRGAAADPQRRKEAILTALDLDPDNPDGWYEYWRAFGYSSSLSSIQRLVDLDGTNPAIFIDLGVVLCEEGRLAEAERYLRQALKLVPRNSLVLYNLAMVLDRLDRTDEARDALRVAHEMHPDDPLIVEGLQHFQG